MSSASSCTILNVRRSLSLHGLRAFDVDAAEFTANDSLDSSASLGGAESYRYGLNSPLTFIDATGAQSVNGGFSSPNWWNAPSAASSAKYTAAVLYAAASIAKCAGKLRCDTSKAKWIQQLYKKNRTVNVAPNVQSENPDGSFSNRCGQSSANGAEIHEDAVTNSRNCPYSSNPQNCLPNVIAHEALHSVGCSKCRGGVDAPVRDDANDCVDCGLWRLGAGN